MTTEIGYIATGPTLTAAEGGGVNAGGGFAEAYSTGGTGGVWTSDGRFTTYGETSANGEKHYLDWAAYSGSDNSSTPGSFGTLRTLNVVLRGNTRPATALDSETVADGHAAVSVRVGAKTLGWTVTIPFSPLVGNQHQIHNVLMQYTVPPAERAAVQAAFLAGDMDGWITSTGLDNFQAMLISKVLLSLTYDDGPEPVPNLQQRWPLRQRQRRW